MSKITLLDGGMGQELVHRAGDQPTPLWSTQVMLDHPDLVRDVHRDYFAAGATIATTNTYAVHRDRLLGSGHSREFEDLYEAALRIATAARDANGAGRIAGAIGPLIASYRPDIHPAFDEAVPLYAEVAGLLGPACDLIICETVVSLDHTRSILEGAKAAGKPIWLAVSVDDQDGTKLRSGERVVDVLGAADGAAAILVNCSAPEAVGVAIKELATGDLPVGGYANGFVKIADGFLGDKPTVDALTAREDLTPEVYAAHALKWVDHGATIVGGCCEVGPTHIATLARALTDAGHEIV